MNTLEWSLARIAELEKELAKVVKELAKVVKELEQIREENKDLKAILEERVSAPRIIFRKTIHKSDDEKKKPGRPEGHEGTSRPMPEKIDEIKDTKLEHNLCPDCGHRAKHFGFRKRIIEDIIPAKIKVTEVHVHQYYCRHCNKIVEAPVTDAFPNCRLGLNTYLLITFLKKNGRLTCNRITETLKTIYNLDISEGEITMMMERVAFEFKDKYRDLIKELQASPYSYTDETSWPVNGINHYLWGFISKGLTIYHIDKTRSQKVAKRFLGEDYRGVVISDFYSGYTSLPGPKQKCLVHLFRELKETAEKKIEGTDFKKFRKEVEAIIHEAINLAGEEEDTIERTRMKYLFEERIQKIIERKWEDKDACRLVKRLKTHKNALFTFLVYPNIKYHNNDAERGLRSNVVIRKISYGSKSEIGAQSHSIIMSVMETCNLRDQNFLEWSHDYLEEKLGKLA
jgi:hypothetical protein